MAFVTCDDSQSVLSTSSGFDSPARGCGGAAKDDSGARRSEVVPGVTRKVWSCSEAGFAALEGHPDFGWLIDFSSSLLLCSSLGACGSLSRIVEAQGRGWWVMCECGMAWVLGEGNGKLLLSRRKELGSGFWFFVYSVLPSAEGMRKDWF